MQCFSNFLLPFCFTVVFMFNLFLVLVKKSSSQQYIVSYIFFPPSRHIGCNMFSTTVKYYTREWMDLLSSYVYLVDKLHFYNLHVLEMNVGAVGLSRISFDWSFHDVY